MRGVSLSGSRGHAIGARIEAVIGGNSATLYRNRFDATYYVGATWKTPPVWITAETPDTDAADLVLQIARTVRFIQR